MEEIKASDIMIGNWVMFKNTTHVVTEISETLIATRWIKSKDKYIHTLSELRPISLTEDILLKCGGTKKEHITLELTKGRKLLFTTRHTKYHQVFLLHDDDMIALSMDKIYLHQLQNLFKSLTGNDLKIEV